MDNRCQDDHSGANPFILSSEIVFETKQPPKPTFQLQDVILIALTNPQAGLPVPFGAGSLLAPPNLSLRISDLHGIFPAGFA